MKTKQEELIPKDYSYVWSNKGLFLVMLPILIISGTIMMIYFYQPMEGGSLTMEDSIITINTPTTITNIYTNTNINTDKGM